MKLFEPGRIGRLYLKNRIIMASMNTSGNINVDGTLSQRGIDYYIARAKGGVGLIVTGACRVSREFDYAPNAHRVLFVDGGIHVAWLSELADALHDYGTKLAVQLQAGRGRIATKKVSKAGVAVSPSALSCFFNPDVMTRELSLEEIQRLISAFQVGAETVRDSGADAIELNFHAGYLADEFVTALWNKRADRYGGDLENRLRFPMEVIRAVKAAAGNDFPVLYKFGLTHYLNGGRQIEEGLTIARKLEEMGVNAFTIDAGCYETQYWTFPPSYQPPGCMVDLAEQVKKVVNVPVIAVGKLGYPELAEKVLVEGKADFIALGRPLLADPEWPNKVRQGQSEDICPCIGDNEGCLGRSVQQKYISCSVNPATGIEHGLSITPATIKKLVLVVGGGPGGMEAARVAASRGHRVILWEKEKALGGNLIPASIFAFKQDYRRFKDYLVTQIQKLNITVEFGKKATPQLVKELKPQVLIIATGSTPNVPSIPGKSIEKVITVSDLPHKRLKDSAVIIGGGLVGFEAAFYLKQKGVKVTIVEILDDVLRNIHATGRMYLLDHLKDIDIFTKTSVLKVTDRGIEVSHSNSGESLIEADTVVIATGFKSNIKLREDLKDTIPETYAIGDCVEPRKVMDAIWEGYRIARLI